MTTKTSTPTILTGGENGTHVNHLRAGDLVRLGDERGDLTATLTSIYRYGAHVVIEYAHAGRPGSVIAKSSSNPRCYLIAQRTPKAAR